MIHTYARIILKVSGAVKDEVMNCTGLFFKQTVTEAAVMSAPWVKQAHPNLDQVANSQSMHSFQGIKYTSVCLFALKDSLLPGLFPMPSILLLRVI